MTLRFVLAAVFLIAGVSLLAVTVSRLLAPQSGWVTIEAGTDQGATDAANFHLLYELDEKTARAETRQVTALYTRLCRTAFELFHNREAFDGVNNVYAINRRPNEVLEVAEPLYDAFAVMVGSGSRTLYLGPVCSRYEGVFSCEDDVQLIDFDPMLSSEVRMEYQAYAGWANDPDAVQLVLLGDNKVRLNVSEAYLAYAAREGIEDFIDFGWMTNAFVADYIADGLMEAGYTKGVLTSFDGFIRCLDSRDVSYSLQLLDWGDAGVIPAAVMDYAGPVSILALRDYPSSDRRDAFRFYTLSNGEVRTSFLDPADGLCRSSIHDLTCFSPTKGCAELALAVSPVFIADTFDPDTLEGLVRQDIRAVWCRDCVIQYTGTAPNLRDLFSRDGIRYSISPAGT